ncbi:MAG: STAS domain-containing protein [bacterium]
MGNSREIVDKTVAKKPISVIKVGGYIDITTSEELEKVIESLLSSNYYNIIVDLCDVDYISSRGWSIFLSKLKDIRDHDGDLKLACMKEAVYEVYVVLEFFWFLKVYDTLEEAISDFELGVPPMP